MYTYNLEQRNTYMGEFCTIPNQNRRDPWEVDTRCNAILVAGHVQGAMLLYALVQEKDHVGEDIIVEETADT